MKKRDKILLWFFLLFYYIFTIKNLFKNYIIFENNFWFWELLIKSFLQYLFFILLLILFLYFYKKILKLFKIFILIWLILYLFNFWYWYNSYPTIEKIKVLNNTNTTITLSIKPIYLFDKEIIKDLDSKSYIEFIIFWWWEYYKLKNNILEIEWYIWNKDIYKNKINVYSITRWSNIDNIINIDNIK